MPTSSDPAATLLRHVLKDLQQLLEVSNKAKSSGSSHSSDSKQVTSGQVRDATKQAIVLVESLSSRPNPVQLSQAIRDKHDIIKPFLMSCETKNHRLYSISLGALQQLLLHNVIPMGGVGFVIESISRLVSINGQIITADEQTSLKLLQMALTILTNSSYQLNQDLLAKLLALCFTMHKSKNVNIANTSEAAIQQATTVIFDALVKAKQSESSSKDESEISNETFSTAKSAYLYISDLCLLANQKEASWLRLSNVDQAFVLDLIETILTSYTKVLLEVDSLALLIKEKLSSIIIEQLSQDITDGFPVVVRLFRVSSSVLKLSFVEKLHEPCYSIISLLSDIISSETVPIWKRVLSLEVFRTLCDDHQLLKRIFEELKEKMAEQSNVLNIMVTAISKCAENILDAATGTTQLNQQPIAQFKHTANQFKRLESSSLYMSQPFQGNEAECLSICIDCLLSIVSSVSVLAALNQRDMQKSGKQTVESIDSKHDDTHSGTTTESSNSINQSTTQTTQSTIDSPDVDKESTKSPTDTDSTLQTCRSMVDSVWCPMLVALSELLEKCLDEDTIRTILQAYLLFVHACTITDQLTARDAFLTKLTRFAPTNPSIHANNPTTSSPTSSSASGYINSSQSSGAISLGVMNMLSSSSSEPLTPDSTLSKKKLNVAQTLLDVGQSQGSTLHESWSILLPSFQELYTLLDTMAFNSFTTEMKSISKSFSCWVQSTQNYTTESLICLLKELAHLASESIITPNPPVMFASNHIIHILRLNVVRITQVWDIVQPHLLLLIEHKDPSIRMQGVSDTFSIIQSIYNPDNLQEMPQRSERQVDSCMEGGQHSQHPLGPNVELDTFSLLLTMSSSKYDDVKHEMIHSLTTLIEQSGELISSSWTIILTVLRSIDPQNSKLIPVAFKSVQLVGNNLECLTLNDVIEYMKTIEFFAAQKSVEDFNICLVAITLLWNLSDFMVKRDFGDRKMELWLILFLTLRKSITDDRPEVRNAAVRTLLFAVASHGGQLDLPTWNKVVSKVLLPVLDDIQHCFENADTTVVNYTVSKHRQKIYQHHSRNTEAKQWSETSCLAIENIGRVIKEHAQVLEKVEGFVVAQSENQESKKGSTDGEESTHPESSNQSSGCDQISKFIRCAIQSHTPEVVKVTIVSLFDIFNGAVGPLRRKLWDNSWDVWTDLAQAADSGHKFMSNTLLTQLIENFGKLYQEKRYDQDSLFSDEDLKKLCGLLEITMFAKNAQNLVTHPSPCQKSVLQLLQILSQHNNDICVVVLKVLMKLLPSDQQIQDSIEGKVIYPKSEEDDGPTTLAHVDVSRAIQQTLISECFLRGENTIRKVYFVDMVKRLGCMMRTKYITKFEYPLWKQSIVLFNSLVEQTLGLFSDSEPSQVLEVWDTLASTIESFLFGINSTIQDKSQEEETSLINLIDRVVLPSSKSTTRETKNKILAILSRASHTAPRAIATESMKCLFRIVSHSSQLLEEKGEKYSDDDVLIEVGLCTMPILLSRCRQVIRKYTEDDKRTGEMPLPNYRRHEVLNVLTQLKNFELHPYLFTAVESDNTKLKKEILNGPKGLILRLFPDLCEIIQSSQDLSLKAVLFDMFRIVSREIFE